MIDVLMYLSNGLIIISFIGYFILLFMGSKTIISKSNAFDVTKDILSEYNSINIIESKSYFTVYNIKRKVIKLASMFYYGNNLSAITLSLIEAGISVVDNNKNKHIDIFRKVFSNLKLLYLFPILAVLINSATYNISDVRISIIFIVIFTVITYMFVDIKIHVIEWINDNVGNIRDINKNNCDKVISFVNKLLWLDKFIFLGELVIIIRFVSILL